jgi:hypothetical protein
MTGFLLACFRRLFRLLRANIHKTCDRQFSQNRVIESGDSAHPFYICLAAHTERPL